MSDPLNQAIDTYQRLVRGDGLIGLMSPEEPSLMTDNLRQAAHDGSAEALRWLGDVYFAAAVPVGAFNGVESDDEADAPLWSAETQSITNDHPVVQAALRAFNEASIRGDRKALSRLGHTSRYADSELQRRVLDKLLALPEPAGAELLLRGWMQNWLGDLEGSFTDVKRAAELGNLDAAFELSLYYGQGLGTDPDAEAAQQWQTQAAEAGHPRALYNRAAAFATGRQTGTPDPTAAAADYRAAALAGHGRAAATLAVMMHMGQVEADDPSGWLDRADEAGFDSLAILEAVSIDDPRSSP